MEVGKKFDSKGVRGGGGSVQAGLRGGREGRIQRRDAENAEGSRRMGRGESSELASDYQAQRYTNVMQLSSTYCISIRMNCGKLCGLRLSDAETEPVGPTRGPGGPQTYLYLQA